LYRNLIHFLHGNVLSNVAIIDVLSRLDDAFMAEVRVCMCVCMCVFLACFFALSRLDKAFMAEVRVRMCVFLACFFAWACFLVPVSWLVSSPFQLPAQRAGSWKEPAPSNSSSSSSSMFPNENKAPLFLLPSIRI